MIPVILLRNVSKDYRTDSVLVRALHDVNLEIPRGEFAVILGPSGSGKTTLLNLLAGIDTPTSGGVTVDGESTQNLTPEALTDFRRRKVGVVFQFFNLIPTLTALENVELVGELCGRAEESAPLLREVGLEERLQHFPSELSGGEQQRVAIARALVKNPAVVLGDEPTGNLDFETGRKILGLLRQINREQNITVLLVTHNTAIAAMADRVIRLAGGTVSEVAENPAPLPVGAVKW
ncbi:MAG: ABC transporter ATP-binding protein [Armatimonadetes bacterium]|nr:ABC transporter ATP-binding protein [Armatimonadota bacterium]